MEHGALLNDLRKSFPEIDFLSDEPMSRHTTFKIGGPADIFCTPASVDAMSGLLRFARERGVDRCIIGGGSNLLVGDRGIRGIVISTAGLRKIEVHGNTILAECGVSLAKLSDTARQSGLAGLEFAHGIPGTVGGAVYMNAGAYGGEMRSVVEYTDYLTASGEVARLDRASHNFGYRKSFFTCGDSIILRTCFSLNEGSREEISAKISDFSSRRQSTQPLNFPSAGSVFKRPVGYYAGKLITDGGLKGRQIGGARVSEKHAGFIVNTGSATCEDVLNLIEHIRKTVYDTFGVELETEVRFVGERDMLT